MRNNAIIRMVVLVFLAASCSPPRDVVTSTSVGEDDVSSYYFESVYTFYQKQGGQLQYDEWLHLLFGGKIPTGVNLLITNNNWHFDDVDTLVPVLLPHNEQLFTNSYLTCGFGSPSFGKNQEHNIYINTKNWEYFAKAKEGWLKQGVVDGECHDGSLLENDCPRNKDGSFIVDGPTKIVVKCESQAKVIVKAKSMFSGVQPTIRFRTALYYSPLFLLSNSVFVEQSWRVPPPLDGDEVEISIETNGSTIFFDDFSFFFETNDVTTYFCDSNYTFDSHLGFSQMCPESTKTGTNMAGFLGYESCIVVPKVTSDGVIVCMHDDSVIRTGRLDSSLAPSERKNVGELTYEELMAYDFGSFKDPYFAGERILSVDDFFAICRDQNMRPIFSTHPPLNVTQWQEIRNKLEQYSLLDTFTVKAFDVNVLNMAYGVFGYDIKGYTGDDVTIEQMNNFVSKNNIDKTRIDLSIENNIKNLTRELVADIVNNGYRPFAFTLNSDISEQTVRDLIEMGVVGFTDDSYCQNGMAFLNY